MSSFTWRRGYALVALLQMGCGCVAAGQSFQEPVIPLGQPVGVIIKLRPSREGDDRVQAAAGTSQLLTSSQGSILLQKLAPGASVRQTLEQLAARQGGCGRRGACATCRCRIPPALAASWRLLTPAAPARSRCRVRTRGLAHLPHPGAQRSGVEEAVGNAAHRRRGSLGDVGGRHRCGVRGAATAAAGARWHRPERHQSPGKQL